jgi:hypothetical protein
VLKDIQTNPFYRPLRRRLLIVATTIIWLGLELWSVSGLWTPIAAAICGFSIWAFLIAYPKTPPRDN